MTNFRRVFASTASALFFAACAASSNDSSHPPSDSASSPLAIDTAPQPSATVTAVASVEPPPATASAAPDLPPYPADAIQRGQAAAQKGCMQLVYKSGCDQLRTGKVTLRVALRDDGTVLSAHVSSNDVKTDPKMVEDCFLDAVEKLHFDPPNGTATSFSIKFALSDKC